MNLEDQIKQKIKEELNPEYFELINESHLHKGHAGDDGSGQTHFKLIIASSTLRECTRMQAHRKVMKVVEPFITKGLHAMSIDVRKV